MWSFGIIVILGLLVLLWVDSLRNRERATRICKTACQRYEVQFLDQTIVLTKLSLRWTRQGIRLRRVYRFEYSEFGTDRLDGYIAMLDMKMTEFSMGLLSSQ